MLSFLQISALDLSNWANQIEAKSQFPELIRRLILASAGYLLHMDFPSGDNTYEGGWDGIVTDAVGTAFIPEGQSVWELGTNKDKRAKAESDYTERTNNPRNVTPSESTLVLATLRNWSANSKREWVAEKKAENVWKDVRLLDAKDLEIWLSTAPAVQYWFARLIGKRPANVIDLETYWLDWAAETTPITPASLLTLGRKNVVEEVHAWLKGTDNSIGLRADSRSEALAFFAAAIKELPTEEQLTYFARSIVVYTIEAWRDLVTSSSPLTLIPLFDDRTVISSALRQEHRVFIPLDRADKGSSEKATEIPRLPRIEVEELLRSLGLPRETADKLAGIARRSFAAFRRALTKQPTIQLPTWVRAEQQSILVAALLIGAWDEQKEQDNDVVAMLASVAYPEVKKQLVRWLGEADPPVRLMGTTWFIVDKGDVWSMLHESITQEQLTRFTEAVMVVLGSTMRRFDLTQEEEYRARIANREPSYSSTLRESLTTTLAYMGSFEEPLSIAGISTSDVATRLVEQLLHLANSDWHLWSALSTNLRWLAEAAPVAFIEGVKAGLSGREPVIMKLFEERKDFFSSSGDYPGLLWALEVLAWHPRYLSRVALVLAKLASLDPGGSLTNRPINSLREIFLPWYPHTAANLVQRLDALDLIQQREPEVAGALLARLSPKAHSVSTGTAKPRWRDWVPTRNVSRKEVYEATLAIQERLLRDAKQDVARWESIIHDLPELPYDQRELVVKQLFELSQELKDDAERMRMRNKLRELISRHRSYRDADWAMHPEEVERLEEVMNCFEPADIISKHAWLFDDWPLLPEGREQDSKAYAIIIGEQQQQALSFIYASGGIETVISFIPHVKSPMALGRALVQSGFPEEQALELVTTYLKAEDESESKFGLGIASALVSEQKEDVQQEWVGAVLEAHKDKWSTIQQAEWLRLLKSSHRTWEKVSSLAKEGQEYYWQALPYFFVDEEDTEEATKLFLQHKQPSKAVELLGQRAYRSNKVPTSLATEALESLLYERPDQLPSSYVIESLLEALAEAPDVDRQRVIKLEFSFLNASFSYRESKSAKLIYEELETNPTLFAGLVATVFRAEGTEARVLTPEESNMQIASWNLLESWRLIPGTDKDGNINKATLDNWVVQAREAMEKSGHKIIGDEQIGQLLSGSSKGNDGFWPHEAVRALIEEVESVDIERGFTIGHFNSRGTTVRGPYEGGVQERALAEEYLGYAVAVESRSPRTGEILRRIAEDYQRQAKREDDEASLNQDLSA